MRCMKVVLPDPAMPTQTMATGEVVGSAMVGCEGLYFADSGLSRWNPWDLTCYKVYYSK